ncbi:MAG: hypothetical protein H0U75_09830 [Legionella sp.]|nr:hypothetical protein [Legionella sp.]
MLPKNRQGFGKAMIVSDEQQLLLNLVRIQFEDRPVFLNVDSITTSNSLASSATAETAFASNPGRTVEIDSEGSTAFSQSFSITRFFGFESSITYSDSPTVSYTPLQGEKFMRHILQPIGMDDVYLLLSSEWSPERVMRIVFAGIGTLHNESQLLDSATFEKQCPPDNSKFEEFVKILTVLAEKDIIFFSTRKIDHVILPNKGSRYKFEVDEK